MPPHLAWLVVDSITKSGLQANMLAAHDLIVSRIRERGPITIAEYMEIALYHPEHGYYASAAQRSGWRGDFFTSVDVGPLFGELIAAQLDEMWTVLRSAGATRFDLVEAGAGNGRLSRDILDAAAAHHLDLYDHVQVTLVERSAIARAAHRDTLGPRAERLLASTDRLPANITGTIVANELLDALPVHVVTMTADGLREIYVAERDGALIETEDDVSDPAVARYVNSQLPTPSSQSGGASIDIGARVEVGLAAIQWITTAAVSLERGFLLLFDYGHPAAELYSATHPAGTLMAYRAHTAGAQHWLRDPGLCDVTAHVNLTAIASAAERAGLETLGMVDQTYFLMALGLADRLSAEREERSGVQRPRERRAWRGAATFAGWLDWRANQLRRATPKLEERRRRVPAIQDEERSGVQGPRERRAWRGVAAFAGWLDWRANQLRRATPKLEERRRGVPAIQAMARRLVAKTLIMPGGLGSTIKVMLFAKGVGRPALRGLSSGRLT